MNSERKQFSPVVCWKSFWNKDNTLNITEINKQSSNYQKSLDRRAQEQAWKR